MLRAGRDALGLLNEPAISVHALDRFTHDANTWNQRMLSAAAHAAARSQAGGASGEGRGSAAGSDGVEAQSRPAGSNGESAARTDDADKPAEAQSSDGARSQNAISASGRPDHERSSSADTSSDGPSSYSAAEHSVPDEAMGNRMHPAACQEQPPKRKQRSRIRALLGRIRRQKEKPVERPAAASDAARHDDKPPAGLERQANEGAVSAMPAQAILSSEEAESSAPSMSNSSQAVHSARAASSEGGGASGLSNSNDVAVDWSKLNSSMMQSVHAMISDLITAAVAKVRSFPARTLAAHSAHEFIILCSAA